MASTFTRVNSVTVDAGFTQAWDQFLDPAWASGTYNNNLALDLNTIASTGCCYRGMPISLASTSGGIIPYASTSQYGGVLLQDVTAFQVAKNGKIGLARKGRVRSYCGSSMVAGTRVKPDPAGNGFVPFASATDASNLNVGAAYPLQDGSTGTYSNLMAQGDQIFVDLDHV